MPAKLVRKVLYHDRTIFTYEDAAGKRYYMLTAALSSRKFKTLDAAKKAIDRGTWRKRRR